MISVTRSDLDALRNHAAYAPLTDRAFLRITGSDATRWLNGMVTNNIKDLQPGEGNYNFLLNAQGRIQGDAMIYREPGDGEPSFLLETGDWQLETVHQHLDRFIIMDDVEVVLTVLGKQGLLVFSENGPQEIRLENEFIPDLARLTRVSLYQTDAVLLTNGLRSAPRYEIYGDPDALDQMLQTAHLPTVSPAALEAHRILSGIPKYGVDITEKDLPQETAQTHALHFSKGCYLGQEIVERIHSRGQVHRTFSRFTLEGAAPALPAPLTADGKAAGELTSAVEVDGKLYALGYVRREHAAKPLAYDGGIAHAE